MSTETPDPEAAVVKARGELATLKTTADDINARIEQARTDPRYSETYRREQVQALRDEMFSTLRSTSARVNGLLDTAHTSAQAILKQASTPTDAVSAAAAAAASARVRDALDALGPGAAAEVFADNNDVDALRALHGALPVYVARTLAGKTNPDRQGVTRELQESIERRLETFAGDSEAGAIRARRAGADEREHLRQLTDHALHPESTVQLLRYAYASSAAPR